MNTKNRFYSICQKNGFSHSYLNNVVVHEHFSGFYQHISIHFCWNTIYSRRNLTLIDKIIESNWRNSFFPHQLDCIKYIPFHRRHSSVCYTTQYIDKLQVNVSKACSKHAHTHIRCCLVLNCQCHSLAYSSQSHTDWLTAVSESNFTHVQPKCAPCVYHRR